MKTIIKAICLIAAVFLVTSCVWDIDPQPTVTVEKTRDVQDGEGEIILHFTPAIRQDIIIKTQVTCANDGARVVNRQLEIPAWTRNANINIKADYIPGQNTGKELTFKMTKVYGNCAIGDPSEVTFKILD